MVQSKDWDCGVDVQRSVEPNNTTVCNSEQLPTMCATCLLPVTALHKSPILQQIAWCKYFQYGEHGQVWCLFKVLFLINLFKHLPLVWNNLAGNLGDCNGSLIQSLSATITLFQLSWQAACAIWPKAWCDSLLPGPVILSGGGLDIWELHSEHISISRSFGPGL